MEPSFLFKFVFKIMQYLVPHFIKSMNILRVWRKNSEVTKMDGIRTYSLRKENVL